MSQSLPRRWYGARRRRKRWATDENDARFKGDPAASAKLAESVAFVTG